MSLSLARERAARSRNGSAPCLHDSTGAWWVVSEESEEVGATGATARRSPWFLRFEGANEVRYIASYPSHRMLLPEAALRSLGELP